MHWYQADYISWHETVCAAVTTQLHASHFFHQHQNIGRESDHTLRNVTVEMEAGAYYDIENLAKGHLKWKSILNHNFAWSHLFITSTFVPFHLICFAQSIFRWIFELIKKLETTEILLSVTDRLRTSPRFLLHQSLDAYNVSWLSNTVSFLCVIEVLHHRLEDGMFRTNLLSKAMLADPQ